MREITGDWLLAIDFVRTGDRFVFDLGEDHSLILVPTKNGRLWFGYLSYAGVSVRIPRPIYSRTNVVTLIPALGGKLHHLVTIEAIDADARRTLAITTSVEAHLGGGEAARRLCHSEG